MVTTLIDNALLEILRCPASGQPLKIDGNELTTADGSRHYEVIDGIPLLALESAEPTHEGYKSITAENRNRAHRFATYREEDVAKFLNGMLVATCGNLFRNVRLSGDYPIPDFPHFPAGAMVLDVGCNWGRWSIAGATAGYRVVGLDMHLESLFCARWLSRKLTPIARPFVLGDARHLPFASETLDGVFSYSVIQHFSKPNTTLILGEIRRVMKSGAKSVIQMPNRRGLRAVLTKGASRNSEGTEFDVRYYSIAELISLFERTIGKSDWYVDCFLGLNVHSRDRRFVPITKRWVVDIAELLLRASDVVPGLGSLADSVFVSSIKNKESESSAFVRSVRPEMRPPSFVSEG